VPRITYDSEANAVYVYLVDMVATGEVAFTRHANIPLDQPSICVDFDADGRVPGLRFWGLTDCCERTQSITRRT